MFARDNKTAPHQFRKKRELTRAVETLKIKYGGGGDLIAYYQPHQPCQLTCFLVFQQVSSMST